MSTENRDYLMAKIVSINTKEYKRMILERFDIFKINYGDRRKIIERIEHFENNIQEFSSKLMNFETYNTIKDLGLKEQIIYINRWTGIDKVDVLRMLIEIEKSSQQALYESSMPYLDMKSYASAVTIDYINDLFFSHMMTVISETNRNKGYENIGDEYKCDIKGMKAILTKIMNYDGHLPNSNNYFGLQRGSDKPMQYYIDLVNGKYGDMDDVKKIPEPKKTLSQVISELDSKHNSYFADSDSSGSDNSSSSSEDLYDTEEDDDDLGMIIPEPQKKSFGERYEEFTKKINNLTPLSDMLITDFDFDINI